MREQAATLLHVSNLFYIPPQAQLGKLPMIVTERRANAARFQQIFAGFAVNPFPYRFKQAQRSCLLIKLYISFIKPSPIR